MEDGDNILIRPRESLAMWQLCQATEWAHLPRAGGWEDQEDIFLHDARIISMRYSYLRKRNRSDKAAHEAARKRLGIK